MEIDIGNIILEEELEIEDITLEEELDFSGIELDTIEVIVDDYEILRNKPSINRVELIHNKQLEDLNVVRLRNSEIDDLINSIII